MNKNKNKLCKINYVKIKDKIENITKIENK